MLEMKVTFKSTAKPHYTVASGTSPCLRILADSEASRSAALKALRAFARQRKCVSVAKQDETSFIVLHPLQAGLQIREMVVGIRSCVTSLGCTAHFV